MQILKIIADRETVRIHTDEDGAVTVRESSPATKSGKTYSLTETRAEGGVIVLPRFTQGGLHDRLFSRYTVYTGFSRADGQHYVSEISPGCARDESPYPAHKHIKSMDAAPDLQKKMFNVEQGRPNVSLPGIMTLVKSDDTIEFTREGETYYFLKPAVEQLDRYIQAYGHNTFILLNSTKGFGSRGERGLIDVCMHPGYDEANPDALISAFNLQTEDGLRFYAAFTEFLIERYSRADGKYGRAVGAVIGNEVDMAGIWGNAGDMPLSGYMSEYSVAMRLTRQIGRKYFRNFRVYISLTNNWNTFNANRMRFYTAKSCLEELAAVTGREGDFEWHVAYHPYPENLFWPDFWHDRMAEFDFNTPHVTFRNMEVLEAFLAQKQFLYNGKQRRLIFSEQGLNSQDGPLAGHTERDGEAGIVLAYMKARNMKTVDMFVHHSSVDNPGEFGLNLGLIRHNGEPKPDYYAFMAMDTDREPEYVEKARRYIGEELFDYLLHPVVAGAPQGEDSDLNRAILTNNG